jgi:hypothetical protein
MKVLRAKRLCLTEVFALAATLAVVASVAQASVYKWVDEKGVTHYSDTLPAEYVNRGNVQLNSRGMPIKKTDPAPTAEQRKLLEDEQARKRELDKLAVEQKRRDDALLATYTSADEINVVRQRNMLVVEDSLTSNRRRLSEFKSRKQELESERTTLEQQGKSLAAVKQRELKSLDEQIPGLEATIYQKRRDMEALRTRYDEDLRRYRELKGNGESASSQ